MAQKTAFATFPNTQPIEFYQMMVLFYGEVKRASLTPKTAREFLRMRNKFDRETFPVLMEFLDVAVGEPVTLGPFARKIFDADDENAARPAIASYLIDLNPLMAKYCLEAMDTEHGGRLHSTNELYRMVTSYVYPGQKPTLNSFKAWVDWAVCAGLLKMIGIRWALGPLADKVLPRLRAIDAEEFLEEEREAATRADEEPEEEPTAAEAVTPAAPAVEPAAVEKPAPEPVPAPILDQPATAPVTPSRPAFAHRVIAPPAASPADRAFFAPARVDSEALSRVRDEMAAWFEQYPERRPLCLAEVGIDAEHRTPATMLEASFAALLLAKGLPAASVRDSLSAFKSLGILLALAKGRFPLDVVANAMVQNADPGFAAACEASVHLPRLLKGTSDQAALLQGETPAEMLAGLWRRLYEPAAPLAPFILARFLFEARFIGDGMAEAGFVPFFAARRNAFRIGFSDRMYAEGFADLATIAAGLAGWFGPPAFEGPLAQVHEAYGCAFRCARVAGCPLACREKGEYAICASRP